MQRKAAAAEGLELSRANTSSGYAGVRRYAVGGGPQRFSASLGDVYLGAFDSAEAAALARARRAEREGPARAGSGQR